MVTKSTKKSPQKFSFSTVFDADGQVLRDGDKWRQSYTKEEVEEVRAAAYEAGRKDEIALQDTEAVAHLAQISDKCTQMLGDLKTQSDHCRNQAMELVLVAARKIAGTALERFPQERVTQLIHSMVEDLRGAPQIRISCPPDMPPQARGRLVELGKEEHFVGALLITDDPELQHGDVSIEWADGQVCINTEEIAQRVDAAIRGWLAAMEYEESAQGDLFAAPLNPTGEQNNV